MVYYGLCVGHLTGLRCACASVFLCIIFLRGLYLRKFFRLCVITYINCVFHVNELLGVGLSRVVGVWIDGPSSWCFSLIVEYCQRSWSGDVLCGLRGTLNLVDACLSSLRCSSGRGNCSGVIVLCEVMFVHIEYDLFCFYVIISCSIVGVFIFIIVERVFYAFVFDSLL